MRFELTFEVEVESLLDAELALEEATIAVAETIGSENVHALTDPREVTE